MEFKGAPPDYLDGAKVIKWTWSGEHPFGYIGNADALEREEVYGFAICEYDNRNGVYRFSCNKNWLVVHDNFYDTIENAIRQLPDQYKNVAADWYTK